MLRENSTGEEIEQGIKNRKLLPSSECDKLTVNLYVFIAINCIVNYYQSSLTVTTINSRDEGPPSLLRDFLAVSGASINQLIIEVRHQTRVKLQPPSLIPFR